MEVFAAVSLSDMIRGVNRVIRGRFFKNEWIKYYQVGTKTVFAKIIQVTSASEEGGELE